MIFRDQGNVVNTHLWYPGSIPGLANISKAGCKEDRSANGPATVMSCLQAFCQASPLLCQLARYKTIDNNIHLPRLEMSVSGIDITFYAI